MAVSELIGAAVGVILLVIVAYVVVSSTLFAAETVTTAQKDLTLQHEVRMRTAITLTDLTNETPDAYIVVGNLTNTGTEIISDFKHMDVIVYDMEDGTYEICTYKDDINRGYWRVTNNYGEFIHPNELDPGEVYKIEIRTVADAPKWFQITTANGVSASAFKK